jgi:hypothetical protein
MNARAPSAIGWLRGLFVVCAVAGLAALSFSYFDRSARPPAKPGSQDIRPVERVGERPQVIAIPTRSVPRVDAATKGEASQQAFEPAYFARPSSPQPPSVPFKFLGKVTDGNETLVLLYGGGQTLTVRGIGELDDDYVVDAIGEAYLVLRHVSLGESQIIELASREPTVETGWSAENTPHD